MGMSIRDLVISLVLEYGTRDPYEIANNLGIEVIFRSYSLSTKGYFTKILGYPFIVINSNLNERDKLIVMAHELGHAILHGEEDIFLIRKHTLFAVGPLEVQSNQFAAELLIDNDDIDECMFRGWNNEQISRYLNVSEELVDYKLKKELHREEP